MLPQCAKPVKAEAADSRQEPSLRSEDQPPLGIGTQFALRYSWGKSG